jgi:hypothetical protein
MISLRLQASFGLRSSIAMLVMLLSFAAKSQAPTAIASGGGSICINQQRPTVTFTFTGTPPFDFLWTDGTTPINIIGYNDYSLVLNFSGAGNYQVLSISDATMTSGAPSNVIPVVVNPLPTATVSGGGSYCAGSPGADVTFNLVGTPPFNILYSNGFVSSTVNGHMSNTLVINQPPSGTYSLPILSDGNGCTNSPASNNTVTVERIPAPVLDAGADLWNCQGTSFSLPNGAVYSGHPVLSPNGVWSTTGDGTFTGGNLFSQATAYVPGPSDISNGQVKLALTSQNPSGFCNIVTDTVTFGIQPNIVMACLGQLNVSIGNSCAGTLTPGMVLPGFTGIPQAFTLNVFDSRNNPLGNNLNPSLIGKKLKYEITNNCNGATCWGNLLVEDKNPPLIRCTDKTVSTCAIPPLPTNTLNGQVWPIGQLATRVDSSTNLRFQSDDLNVSDCSTEYGISVNESVQGDPCSTRVVSRIFTATDILGNSSVCTQTITVNKPLLGDIIFPSDIRLNCGATSAQTSATISGAGVPTLGGVPIFPNGPNCTITVNFKDDVVSTCPGTTKIIRRWSAMDMCTPGVMNNYTQVILIQDTQGPVITFAMNMVDTLGMGNDVCTSDGLLAIPFATDNCSTVASIQATVEGGGNVEIIDANRGLFSLKNSPAGVHIVTYTAFDGCGNSGTVTRTVIVRDNKIPEAVCTQNTVVALNTDGTAKLDAVNINSNSRDNCGIKQFQIRRMTPVCVPLDGRDGTSFGDWIPFRCCETGETLQVVMQVEDVNGLTNTCMVNVTVQDKIAPQISCPKDFTISCDGCNDWTPNSLSSDNSQFGWIRPSSEIRNHEILEKDAYDSNNNGNFSECIFLGNIQDGEITEGCFKNITVDVVTNKKCSWNTTTNAPDVNRITRTFTAFDLAGNSSTCVQNLIVENRSNFLVLFPADTIVNDCAGGNRLFNQPIIYDNDCELMATEYKDEIFSSGPNACMKIIRTWKVADWCIMDPTLTNHPKDYSELDLQRDLNGDGNFNASNSSRLFRDGMGSYADGYMEYQQVILIQDKVAPTFTDTTSFINICDKTDNNPVLFGSRCESSVTINVSATDACSPVSLTYMYQLDIDSDGTIDETGTTSSYNGELPYGNHRITFMVTDACGNMASKEVKIRIQDCKKPTIICHAGLSANLMNVRPAMVTLWANDFVLKTEDNCGPVSDLRIRRTLSFPQTTISTTQPPVGSTFLTFNCNDIAAPVPVELWGVDNAGNWDYCTTFIVITDNFNSCIPIAIPKVVLDGRVERENADPVKDVEISVNGTPSILSEIGGTWIIGDLDSGKDYTVLPKKNNDLTNGVDTRDLSVIQRHILGISTLNSPYNLIAADVTKDNKILASDIAELRKVILGIRNDFPNGNTSWRFVDKKFRFLDPSRPFATVFPELINLNNVNANTTADFVAIKVGDVNLSASVNATNAEVRTNKTWNIFTEEKDLTNGKISTVPFYAEQDGEGFQFTIQIEKNQVEILEVIKGDLKSWDAEKFAIFHKEGTLTFSYNGKVNAGDKLFSIILMPSEQSSVREILTLNSSKTTAIAFNGEESFIPELQFTINNKVVNNEHIGMAMPNPSTESVALEMNLMDAQEIQFRIFDASGKMIHSGIQSFEKGKQLLQLNKSDFGMANGLLILEVRTNSGVHTQKLIRQ